MQTPLQAPICLHGQNQETRDTTKLWSVDFPPASLEQGSVLVEVVEAGGGVRRGYGGLTAD